MSISYPLGHPVYDDVSPEFKLSDWGNMAAEITDQIISENKLGNEVIANHWSEAGQVIRPFNQACKNRAINVQFALGIETSPALQIPSERSKGIKKTDKNMLSLIDPHFELFWREIEDQNQLNSREILNKKHYEDYFWGDIPVGIAGGNEFIEEGEFVEDIAKGFNDKKFFAFTEYPLVATVSGNSTYFPYHPIVDKSTWAFLNTRNIYYGNFVKAQQGGFKFSRDKLGEMLAYIDEMPRKLSRTVSGTHFLFVGSLGAQAVVNYLVELEKTVSEIKDDISGILS